MSPRVAQTWHNHGTGTGGSSEPTPNLHEDFNYANLAALKADAHGYYDEANDASQSQIFYDTTIKYGSNPGSMELRFPDVTGNPGTRCAHTIGRDLILSAAQTEIWWRAQVRFTNFDLTPSWIATCPGGGSFNPDYKMCFGLMTGSSRFDFRMGNSYNSLLIGGYPGNEEAFTVSLGVANATEYFNDLWHKFEFHWKFSTSGAGKYRLKINDETIINETGLSMSGVGNTIRGIAVGRNRDPGAEGQQSVRWGDIQVWHANNSPGWAWAP